jgi:glycosyltransferase
VKITIITVAYNSAGTIADTLASVAAQTHADIEHIVVDGGSTDGTQAVVNARGSAVSRFVSERDAGIYDAMNKGLAMATGDWVGFLNADDAFAHTHIVAAIAKAAASDADVIYGDLLYVGEESGRTVRYWRAGRFQPRRLRLGWMPPHPTLYVRRSLMKTVGGFDTTLRIAADYEYMLRLLTRPSVRVRYLPQVLVRMRTGGASNRSARAVFVKSSEDLTALRRHRVGGWFSLACKNLRKLSQFVRRPAPAAQFPTPHSD